MLRFNHLAGLFFLSTVAFSTYVDAGPPALEVSGNIKMTNGGTIVFPDGSTQATATLQGPQGPPGIQGLPGPSGAFPWYQVNAIQQMESNSGYLAVNPASQSVFILPTYPAIGGVVKVVGVGAGGWKLAQNDGQQIVTSKIPFSGYSWTSTETTRDWRAVAMSANGQKLFAAAYNDQIFVSIDSGATWIPRAFNNSWSSIASSADGSKIIASAFSDGTYTSIDSGSSWAKVSTYYGKVACSPDGTKMLLGTSGGLFASSDSGGSWSSVFPYYVDSVAISLDGSKYFASTCKPTGSYGLTSALYVSNDAGTTWIDTYRNQFSALAPSASGTKIFAVGDGDPGCLPSTSGFFMSSNAGATWTELSTGFYPRALAISSDGTKIIAGTGGSVYTSWDSGVTWLQQSVGNGEAVATSADGSVMIATKPLLYLKSSSGIVPIGTSGSLHGGKGDSIELMYVGDGRFMPISFVGSFYMP